MLEFRQFAMARVRTRTTVLSWRIYDPHPNSFRVKDLVTDAGLEKSQLSDLVIGALRMALKVRAIRVVPDSEHFQALQRGAKLLSFHTHVGRPFLAPDGTVMSVDGIAYAGDTVLYPGHTGGIFNLNNVHTHPNYDEWLAGLLYGTQANAYPSLQVLLLVVLLLMLLVWELRIRT